MSGMTSTDNHYVRGELDVNTGSVIVCSSLALYNAVETLILIFATFNRYHGLYFWALTVSSFGIIPYVVGYGVEFFYGSLQRDFIWSVGTTVDTVGWVLMVTGQAVVLYSRLHLVFERGYAPLLRKIKWMIIVDGFVFHSTTAVAVYGSRFLDGPQEARFAGVYNKVEQVQMVVFCTQELILSSLYIWKAIDMIKLSERRCYNSLTWQLLSMNVVIIAMDISLLAVEFLHFHVLQQTFKGFIYSVKLKLELLVLNKLVQLSEGRRLAEFTVGDTNEFVDPSKTVWDISRFASCFESELRKPPRWVAHLEKSGFRRVGGAHSPMSENNWMRVRRQRRGEGVDAVDEVCQRSWLDSTFSDRRVETREVGSATDLLYADAVRELAGYR